MWDAATGKAIAVLSGHEGPVLSAAFSPDGARAVTASSDKTARVWDVVTGKQIVITGKQQESILCKGCLYIGIEANNAVKTIDSYGIETQIDLASGEKIVTEVPRPNGLIHLGSLATTDLFVSDPDHQLLSLEDGSVRLMTAETDLPAHSASISHVLFLNDGRIVTGAIDGTVRIIEPGVYAGLERLDIWPTISKIAYGVTQYFARAAQSLAWLSPGSKAISTGAARPPGGVMYVLTIGINDFGDKAGGLRLDYAVNDAHDVAAALLNSQKGQPEKPSLYANVQPIYLTNEKAGSAAILDSLDAVAESMARNEQGKDVAVILVSTHIVMLDGQSYLIPYGFDAGSKDRSVMTAISATEFAKKVAAIASHGKVLVLLDAAFSGALLDALNLDDVTVLTSSRNEASYELPEWKHGALTQSFLDALAGAADSKGIVKLSALIESMQLDVQTLTKGQQHLGMHVNFEGDLFVKTSAVDTAVRPGSDNKSPGWPDTIEGLTRMRSQAEACVGLLKVSGDKAAIEAGRLTYEQAKAKANGVIAGLTTALVQGYTPEALPTLLSDVEEVGAQLQGLCNAAVKTISTSGRTK